MRRDIFQPLDANLGAQSVTPHHDIGGPWATHRFEMDNGDLALFARGDDEAFWMGNTETPESLWRTDKRDWSAVPYPVARWAQREYLDRLHEEDPWLAEYPYISWFFLPVFLSKDGRDSTRAFFSEHAAGFPDAGHTEAADYVESLLRTVGLENNRSVMAGKLGTSDHVDRVRMSAAMAEFIAAKVLVDAGYEVTPEAEVSTGHSLDFRATDGDRVTLVEVTRPQAPATRNASGPVAAVKDTVENKTAGQLSKHGGGAVLFVDCSTFPQSAWDAVSSEQPDVGHRPAVVYRARPTDRVEGYRKGRVPLDLEGALEPV